MGWTEDQEYKQVSSHKNYIKSYLRGGWTTKDIDGYLVSKTLLKSYLWVGQRTKGTDWYLVPREPLSKTRKYY